MVRSQTIRRRRQQTPRNSIKRRRTALIECDMYKTANQGARLPSGRASDSESGCPGFDPHNSHIVVSLNKTHLLSRVQVNTHEALAPSRHD